MPEAPPSGFRENRERALLIGCGVLFYWLLCLHVFLRIHKLTDHHFFFSLDDPYIHFALARSIASGSYFINLGEATSPSSSILWPYLLALFSHVAALPTVALFINLLAGTTAAVVSALTVTLWPGSNNGWSELVRRLLAVCALVFIGNLVGLTFIGMEHLVQVCIAGASAYAMVKGLQGQAIPMLCLVAAAVGPSIRYECVSLTLAIAIVLYSQGLRRRAAILLVVSLLPLILFSMYLHHLGLPLLPLSVLVKANQGGSASAGAHTVLAQLRTLVQGLVSADDYQLVALFFAILLGLAFSDGERARRVVFLAAASVPGLHLLLGKFNWFHRYEVYVVFFSVLIILYAIHEHSRMPLGWFVLGLVGCSYLYKQAYAETPLAAQDIYLQQYQTHRFLSDFYAGNFAVNDLGIAAFERQPNQYVLDLAGLGSAEVAHEKNRSVVWLDSVTREHKVGVVALYPEWFAGIPLSWTELGSVCVARTPVVMSHACVHYYATPEASLRRLQQQFAAFVATVPPGDITHLGSSK